MVLAEGEEEPLKSQAAPVTCGPERFRVLAEEVEVLSTAESMESLVERLFAAARKLACAEGVTLIAREGDQVHYLDEDAIGPLWQGRRFPVMDCVTGLSIVSKETIVIPDVSADPRVPQEAYAPTFVKSMVVTPVDAGVSYALGVYWARVHQPPSDAVEAVETLARVAGAVIRPLEAEGRLRELNETLEQRVIAEVGQRVRVEDVLRQAQKMEAIGQLTGGVAHDFNNLLTVIRSSADLLRRRDLDEERRRRYVDAISDTADRAAKLTSQLLAFARRQSLRAEIFDVGEQLGKLAEMLRPMLGPRIDLQLDVRCAPCSVEADVGQFETAVLNMAINARDAMGGEGTLRFVVRDVSGLPAVRGHAASCGDFIAVDVIDSGSGMSPETLSRVFEPFFTTKEVGRGTGLGLSQVYGFAKQSGGEVDVTSQPGTGSTFTLYLPRATAKAAPSQPPAATELPSGRGRVLLVEDNASVGEFASQLLRDLGYEATLTTNAQEALSRLSAEPQAYDLVFSDVVMPGMSGVELARRIREAWPSLPVVLTTGYSHTLAEDARHGFPVLAKPYAVEDLARVLRQAVARRPSPP